MAKQLTGTSESEWALGRPARLYKENVEVSMVKRKRRWCGSWKKLSHLLKKELDIRPNQHILLSWLREWLYTYAEPNQPYVQQRLQTTN